jgi:dTDP-N-acetylfucosamine:lipid II N-acetylfucosaminyltransferase
MPKFIHLVDDEKFIKYAFESFSKLDKVDNEFLCISNKKNLDYIDFDCVLIDNSYLKSDDFVETLNNCDLLIIHFLNTKYYDLLSNKKLTPKILWIGWGGDYYWMIDTLKGFNIYKPITNTIYNKFRITRYFNYFNRLMKKTIRKKNIKIINRINYFAPVLIDDYELIIKNNAWFKPDYFSWNYGTLEDNYIKGLEDFQVSGSDIMIGNSATITNNHLDILQSLKQTNVENCKIIIPLNYGDLMYGKLIYDKAKALFGNQVEILNDYLPYDDYLNLVKNCNKVFMGHIRQQAMGNVITLLYFGSKIFFFKESVTYTFLIKSNIKVYLIEDFVDKPKDFDFDFSIEELTTQRNNLLKIWGREINALKTKSVLELIK